MATETDKSPDDQLAEMKRQVEILQQQLALVNTQLALDAAQAKPPLAELTDIKDALDKMQLPTGASGTIQVAAGIPETALLRSKGPMIRLLDDVAKELKTQLPNGAVIVTEAQLDQAYKATFTQKHITDQIQNLETAIKVATPSKFVAQLDKLMPLMPGLETFAATAYSLGFVLDTVNSLSKLFRVDRKVDIFAADTEALQMLGYLLEGKGSNFVANPAMIREEAMTEAKELLEKLNDLCKAIHRGNDVLAQLKKIEEEETKTKQSSSKLPAADVITELKMQIEVASSLLDGLHPGKKPDEFWAQVKGQLIWKALENRDQLLLEAKAHAIQITEKRWWRSDSISMLGEVQVAYRILDKDGKVKDAGVILKSSKAEKTSLGEMLEFSFPILRGTGGN